MNEYFFDIEGRQRGAIGIFMRYSARVLADSYDAAVIKLYDRYEHIRVLSSASFPAKAI